jgi:rod shape-determining protein MreD
MADLGRFETLAPMALWLLIAAVSIVLRLLPLGHAPGWPMPDLLLALTLAWVLRRQSHLPAVLIALVFLAEDLFLMRPPGLWALMVLLGSEFLRRRESVVRELNLLFEWAMVAGVMAAMVVANRVLRGLVFIPNEPLLPELAGLLLTILTYPLVVVLLQGVLRIRKPATGEVDELGRKL